MNRPTLSVITPSYNSAEFIEDAMASVRHQEGAMVEHIVIDGASADQTVGLVRRFRDVQLVSEPDRGQSDAINKGFRCATGDLMGWLNADDYYLPGALAAVAGAAEQHPQADIIYGDCVFVDADGKLLRSKVEHEFDPAILMYFGCYIPSTATFFRRRIIDSGLLLNCDYGVCMDFEYFARLAHAGFTFHYVPQFLAAFRWHATNVSLTQHERRREERLLVQRRFTSAHSASVLGLLATTHRGKRVLRKVLSGNIRRELRLRRMLGCDTRWLHSSAGLQTCKTLASL